MGQTATIEGFTIDADNEDTNLDGYYLIQVGSSDEKSVIKNNIIKTGATDTSSNIIGIHLYSYSTSEIQNNEFQIYATTLGIKGIHIRNDTGGSSIIKNNSFDNPYDNTNLYFPVELKGDAISFDSNTFLNGASMCIGVTTSTYDGCPNVTFTNNLFLNSKVTIGDSNALTGVKFYKNKVQGYLVIEGKDNCVANNIIAKTVDFSKTTNFIFRNNTIYGSL